MKNSSFKKFMELHHIKIRKDRKKYVLNKYLLSVQVLHSFMCEGAKVCLHAISIEQFYAYADRIVFQYKITEDNSLKRFIKFWVKQLRLTKPKSVAVNIFDNPPTLEVLSSYDRLQEVVFTVLLKRYKNQIF